MITHSHFEKKPKILNTLKMKDSFFSEVIPFLEEPYFFQFENGALYQRGNDPLNKICFNRSMENMNIFLKNKLNVLKERLQLELICQNILKKRKLLIDKKKL